MSAKGQITSQQVIPDHLGAKPDEQVDVELLPDGQTRLRSAGVRSGLAGLCGVLQRPGQKPVSLAEMQGVIEEMSER